MKEIPLVIVTVGDPSGIGPEITIKSFIEEQKLFDICVPVIIGDSPVLKRYIENSRLRINVIDRYIPEKIQKNTLNIINLGVLKQKVIMGRVEGVYGKASIGYVNFAVSILQSVIRNPQSAISLVTAPVSKAAVIKSGIKDFTGHTEYLANTTNSKKVAMLMVSDKYKVLLVTRHIPLKNVASKLRKKLIIEQVLTVNDSLKKYSGLKKIIVCGLNPHCGEGAKIGNEEEKIITPAISELKRYKLDISGPVPPEYIFSHAGKNDLIVCHYHDQAMVPLKLLCKMKLVNLTCGLPFLRTSPAHGTAFDIAGKNKADPTSMIEAIKLAASCN